MRTILFTTLLIACGGESAPKPDAHKEHKEEVKKEAPKPVVKKEAPKPAAAANGDMMAAGKEVYENSTLACKTCHGPDGKGTPGVFPPLVGQKDHMGDCVHHAGIVINGLQGELEVNGTKYNGVMTPQGDMLDDNQIAAVITYERNSWGNSFGNCTAEDVKKARAKKH